MDTVIVISEISEPTSSCFGTSGAKSEVCLISSALYYFISFQMKNNRQCILVNVKSPWELDHLRLLVLLLRITKASTMFVAIDLNDR